MSRSEQVDVKLIPGPINGYVFDSTVQTKACIVHQYVDTSE